MHVYIGVKCSGKQNISFSHVFYAVVMERFELVVLGAEATINWTMSIACE